MVERDCVINRPTLSYTHAQSKASNRNSTASPLNSVVVVLRVHVCFGDPAECDRYKCFCHIQYVVSYSNKICNFFTILLTDCKNSHVNVTGY